MKRIHLAMAAAFLIGGSIAAQGPAVRPIATDLQMMEAFIIPASNALFDAGSKEPKTAADWAAVRNNALILAEAGNLLQLRQRKGDNGDWKKFSIALTDAGLAALKAVEAKDIDKLTVDVGEQILNSCETCHAKYLKGAAK